MGATGIEWTQGPNGEQGYSFNPWIGCTKVSPACDGCYAEVSAIKLKVEWGSHADRRPVSDATWDAPKAWDRRARRLGCRFRVFCASMADVFDNHRSIRSEWRAWLYELIESTPNLDWMLLTKRPQNAVGLLPARWTEGHWPRNAWFGFTAENQVEFSRRWNRAKHIPAPLFFVSAEPLLEAYNLPSDASRIGLFIAGGESGTLAKCRDTPIHVFTSMRQQCQDLGIPFFMKQLAQVSARSNYKKFEAFPPQLQVREQPRIRA